MTSSSRRPIPTIDRISDLPDSILSHILSFLPTKEASATSILSKRWKSVWLSVFALNFDDQTFNDYESFRKCVSLIMFELRDEKASIHSFTLKLGKSSRFNKKEFNEIFKFVMQRGIKNLDFNMSGKKRLIKSPPAILRFKTLEVLKLANVTMGNFDQVDFPRLKTLHLDRVYFNSPEYFVKLLFGCPILEDLHTKSFIYEPGQSYVPMENLNALPNLVKVRILSDMNTLMNVVCMAKILHIEK
ncbi:F-box/FBD/LRR-repeat protein, partial [Trifolium medium]|nr:F-box/FBD/LRR-repeat protein [Trifolium medium]